MQLRERVPQELRNCKPEDFETMAGLIYAIDGPLPFDEHKFTKGLEAAIIKAPFLEIFIGERYERITDVARLALWTLETMGIVVRTDENWIVSDSGDPQNTPKNQLKNRVESVFNQRGIAVLKEAAEAARQVWSAQEA